MAKKRATRKKVQSPNLLSQLRSNVNALQRNVLDRVHKQAALLGRDRKQAVGRLTRHAARMQTDLEKDARRLSTDVESRANRFVSAIEKRIQESLESLVGQLDLPSRQDVQTLSRRIAHLEQQLRRQARAEAEATPAPAPAAEPPEDEPGTPGAA